MMLDSADAFQLTDYRVDDTSLQTPMLMIYADLVQHNIDCMIRLLSNEPNRWRPHLKTAKLGCIMRMLVEAGVKTAKCATTLELLAACQAGFEDVLVAYPHMGRNAQRIAAIAALYPEVRVSAMVESNKQIVDWVDTSVDLFIDLNTGMNRTGIDGNARAVTELAEEIRSARLHFRGLHFYDGNSTEPDPAERAERANARYDQLFELISDIEGSGTRIGELITSGTPALPCAVVYRKFWNAPFTCQVSPGTVVYNDASSLAQLPAAYGFRPAAVVISQVVSHPKPDVITCDAGHKSVSVDSGVPNCLVLANDSLHPLKPSEEHLPLSVHPPADAPALGTMLYLLPRHVCPTVNNFDVAAIVKQGMVVGMERVTARGHEHAA